MIGSKMLAMAAAMIVAAPAGAVVTALGASTKVSGGDSTGAGCADTQSGQTAPLTLSSTCLLDGGTVADAHVMLDTARSGSLEAGGASYDAGPGQSYASSASASYSFTLSDTALFRYSGHLAIVTFADIHGGDEFDFPLDASILTPLGGTILRAPGGSGFDDSFLLGPGSYRVGLDGSASGSSDPADPSDPGGFYYTSNTSFIETLAFTITDAPPAPEPAAWTMLIGGIGAAGAARRRRDAGARRLAATKA